MGPCTASNKSHIDYTHEYGQKLVDKLVGARAEEVKKSRYQMLKWAASNIRPL